MQEPKDDKDKEYCDNVNKYINNPPQPSQTLPIGGLGEFEGLGQAQLLQLLGGNPQALSGLSSLIGAGGARPQSRSATRIPASSSSQSSSAQTSKPSQTTPALPNTNTLAQQPRSPTPAPRSAPASAPGVQLDTLQRIISELTQAQPKGPSLKDIVNVDEILNSGLFDSPEVVAKLAEFLPEGQVTAANMKDNIRSPQFSQAVSMFNQALRTGQMTGIMSSFGLDPSTVGPNATIEDFLRAIQKKAKEDTKEKEKNMDTSE